MRISERQMGVLKAMALSTLCTTEPSVAGRKEQNAKCPGLDCFVVDIRMALNSWRPFHHYSIGDFALLK